MNCPKCNSIVAQEWQSCPICGYQPLKCRCTTCNRVFWQLSKDSAFCPQCGGLIYGDIPGQQEFQPEKKEQEINIDKLNGIINLLKVNAYKPDSMDYAKGTYPGYRLYIWGEYNMLEIGWNNKQGKNDGVNLLFAGSKETRIVLNCPNARFFVGEESDGEKNGMGTCYDKYGSLIYYGPFRDNKPTGTYPTPGDGYKNYRFELIEYTDGDRYIGETKYGKRQGKGLYIWKDGSCWYGAWKDDSRDGRGVYFSPEGKRTTGNWKGDNMV